MSDHAIMLEFLADRLVHVYGESPNMDFILAARRMAGELRRLKPAPADDSLPMPTGAVSPLAAVAHLMGPPPDGPTIVEGP